MKFLVCLIALALVAAIALAGDPAPSAPQGMSLRLELFVADI